MFIINRSPRITTKKTIELYLDERVGGLGNPTSATALFSVIVPIPELPLYVSRAALKIDIKCTNYLNLKKDGENSSIELGSGLVADKEEMSLSGIAVTYPITDVYKTFYFPLNLFYTYPDFNPLTIQRIRIYLYYTTGTGQVSWKNAFIIL